MLASLRTTSSRCLHLVHRATDRRAGRFGKLPRSVRHLAYPLIAVTPPCSFRTQPVRDFGIVRVKSVHPSQKGDPRDERRRPKVIYRKEAEQDSNPGGSTEQNGGSSSLERDTAPPKTYADDIEKADKSLVAEKSHNFDQMLNQLEKDAEFGSTRNDLMSDIFDELLPPQKQKARAPAKKARHVPHLAFDAEFGESQQFTAKPDEGEASKGIDGSGADKALGPLEQSDDIFGFKAKSYRSGGNPLLDSEEVEPIPPVEMRIATPESEAQSAKPNISSASRLGLLILRSASKHLDESDFKCLIPSGKHIEGWSTGGRVLKIIRGRDENTLIRNGDYYILLDSEMAADEYLDRAHAIHRFAGHFDRKDLTSPFPPQPSAFEEQHPGRMLHAFALAPPSVPLNLTMKLQPWPPFIRALLDKSGYEALVQNRQSEHEVLLSVEGALLHHQTIRKCIFRDGQQRRIYWGTVGDRLAVRSFDLNSTSPRGAVERNKSNEEQIPDGSEKATPEFVHRRFVVSFASREEAQRFALSWHRRDIKDLIEGFAGEQAVVNAELTW